MHIGGFLLDSYALYNTKFGHTMVGFHFTCYFIRN